MSSVFKLFILGIAVLILSANSLMAAPQQEEESQEEEAVLIEERPMTEEELQAVKDYVDGIQQQANLPRQIQNATHAVPASQPGTPDSLDGIRQLKNIQKAQDLSKISEKYKY